MLKFQAAAIPKIEDPEFSNALHELHHVASWFFKSYVELFLEKAALSNSPVDSGDIKDLFKAASILDLWRFKIHQLEASTLIQHPTEVTE